MKHSLNRILIVAGGTGGHIFPALAVATALKQQGNEVHWLGAKGGLEERLVPDHFPISYLRVRGLRRNGWRAKLLAPFSLVKATFKAYRLLRHLRPQVVIGMGGYATGPAGVASWLARIPLVIHEQNAIPGMTNRILAKFAQRVLQAFPATFQSIQADKLMTLGNPVRQTLLAMPDPQTRLAAHDHGPLRILVLGGSQGARAINQTMVAALDAYQGDAELSVWHQTGQLDFMDIKKRYTGIRVPHKVEAFIDDMAEAYAWADIVICRSGALTVSELAVSGVASVLIPFPYAVDDHQYHNGRFLEQADASIIIRQNDLTTEKLIELFTQFYHHRDQLLAMAQAAKSVAKPEATEQVVLECTKFINK